MRSITVEFSISITDIRLLVISYFKGVFDGEENNRKYARVFTDFLSSELSLPRDKLVKQISTENITYSY